MGAGRTAEDIVQALGEGVGHGLEEAVLRDEGGAVVCEAAVHEQQVLEEAELRDAVVRGARRLLPLLAQDADADVRLLDH